MADDPAPDPSWTAAEQWVWREALAGREADLNRRDGGTWPDPCDPAAWESAGRTVRPGVVAVILAGKPWCDALPAGGLRLAGALIPGGLALEHLQLSRPLWLERCRIAGDLSLRGTRLGSEFSLDASCVAGETTLSAMRAGYVSWKGTQFDGCVEAILVRCELSLHAWDARFGGKLRLLESSIGGGLSLDRIRARSGVDLSSSTVVGDISLVGARITGQLDCSFLRARSLVFAVDAARHSRSVISRGLSLHGAAITGNVDVACLCVGRPKGLGPQPAVSGQQVEIAGWLRLAGLAASDSLDLSFGRIGHVDMRGARSLARVDMHGTQVAGELLMDLTTKWRPGASLDLRNAKVGSLQDGYRLENGVPLDSWPNELHLHGFNLDRLGGFGDQGESSFMDRPPDWFADWLKRTWEHEPADDKLWSLLPRWIRWIWPTYRSAPRVLRWLLMPWSRNTGYRPSTYRTFATKLRELGRPTTADRLEFASREIERRNSVFPRSAGLRLQRVFIGYGIGSGYFLSLAWAVGLAGLCMIVGIADGHVDKPLSWWVLACVDHVLPIVSFEKEYGETLPAKLGFWWSKLVFDMVTLVSWVIGLMLAAGIAGITQRAK